MLKKILLTVVLMVSGTCCASEYERVCDFNQQDSDYIKNLQRELWSLDIPRHQEDRLHIGFLKIDEHALEAMMLQVNLWLLMNFLWTMMKFKEFVEKLVNF
jgi:hypothetical protein